MYYLIITIHILGGVQGFFLSFLLLTLKDRLKANKFLAFMVFTLSVTLTITFLHFTKLILHVPYFFMSFFKCTALKISGYLNPI